TEPLSGAESQTLRTFFTSNYMDPNKDLDSYGWMLFTGDLAGVKADFERRKANVPHNVAVNQIFALRWGSTQTPVFNCLLLSTLIQPGGRQKVLDVARWLIAIGVPVDGKDLSGTTAFAHSISTKPAFDIEYAKILLDAGADINHRNRYGSTCAHEFCMVWTPLPDAVARAKTALGFFLSNGGDPNIADNDGITVMRLLRAPWMSGLKEAAEIAERKRKQNGCWFCGSIPSDRHAVELLRCSRCKKARYCSPPKGCQRSDWPNHKQG
ncbi:hypothetical protein M422DRAFT_29744, partial [Sphaerobolus stellatus SS14]